MVFSILPLSSTSTTSTSSRLSGLNLSAIDRNQRGFHEANGKFYYHLGAHRFIEANSRAELEKILAAATVSSGMDLHHLNFTHLRNRTLGAGLFDLQFNYMDDRSVVITAKSDYLQKVDLFNNLFFGANVPILGTGALLNPDDSRFDFELGFQGVRGQAERSALIGTAYYLYRSNYVEGNTPGVNESIQGDGQTLTAKIDPASLNTDTLALIRQLFGSNTAPNRAHLNVLKLLGFIDVKIGLSNLSNLVLNDLGEEALKGLTAKPTNLFVPANTLQAMMGSTLALAEGSKSYFQSDGASYREGMGLENSRKAASSIVGALNKLGNPSLPVALNYQGRAVEMLNALFQKPADNHEFSANEINTAIAMGLLHFDPSTNQVRTSTIGGTFVEKVNPTKTNAPPGTNNTPELTPHQAAIQEFWNAANNFNRNGGAKFADWAEWHFDPKGADRSNGRYAMPGVQHLANANAYSPIWNDAGLSHLTIPQREQLIKDAQVMVKHQQFFLEAAILLEFDNGSQGTHGSLKNRSVNRDELGEWLNRNNNKWTTDTLTAAKITFSDPYWRVPADFQLGDDFKMSDQTEEFLNQKCKEIFGVLYDQMSADQKKRALYLLTHVHQVLAYNPPEYEESYFAVDWHQGETKDVLVSLGELYIKT